MPDADLSTFYTNAEQSYRIAVQDMVTADDVVEEGAEKYPIRKIFRDSLPGILKNPVFTAEQKKAAACIAMCKTPDLGFNASYCPQCDKLFVHYASCNNRNCPCCQNPSQQAWVAQRDNEVIPDIPYYHIILTVPHLLNDLIIANQKELLGALFQSASQAAIELCQDRKFLGAVPGIVVVLHTWSQRLLPHFHIHMIVSGGGLDSLGQFVSIPEKQSKRNWKSLFSMRNPYVIVLSEGGGIITFLIWNPCMTVWRFVQRRKAHLCWWAVFMLSSGELFFHFLFGTITDRLKLQ